MIVKLIENLAETAYVSFVQNNEKQYTMQDLIGKHVKFENNPFARYATDMTLQQANRRSGNIEEGKLCFSGKDELYGYNIEVSVLQNGLSFDCTRHYPGSVSDLEIFQKNLRLHRKVLSKKEGEST